MCVVLPKQLEDTSAHIPSVVSVLVQREGEGSGGRVRGVDGRVRGVDGRVRSVDGRVRGVDGWVRGVDGWVRRVDGRVRRVNGRVSGVDGWRERRKEGGWYLVYEASL